MMTATVDRASALIARARALHADLAALCVQSRGLIESGRERRFSAIYPRLRPIRGGSDSALIVMAITNAAACLPCIAKKTGVPVIEVNHLLLGIVKTLRLAVGQRRCDLCLESRTTFSITKSDGPRSPNQR